MNNDGDPEIFNSIEVKGMNRMSIPYIKRYFTNAGKVEEVKKLGSSVIIKFKYHRAALKAYRFQGKIVDKEPIKIRNISPIVEEFFHDQPPQVKEKREATKRIANKLKSIPLNLSSHWNLITYTISTISNERLRWLLLELFSIKLEQIMHIYLYHSNMKSEYKQIHIKELILNVNMCPKIYVSAQNENVEVLQLKIEQPKNLQTQSSYSNWSNQLDIRIRNVLRNMGKDDASLENLIQLYCMMETNSLIIEEDAIIIPKPFQHRSYHKQYLGEDRIGKNIKASIGNATQSMFEVNFKEEENLGILQRCCFRSISEDHPSKEIEVVSESHFHQSPVYTEIYTFFKNPFSGCVSNIGVSHIFQEFSRYYHPNYIYIRHYNMKRHKYIRLQFSLRLLNCQTKILKEESYFRLFAYEPEKETNSQISLCQLSQINLAKHTLVINQINNPEKVLYMIQNYAHYILTKAQKYFQESQSEIDPKDFIVILICECQSNDSLENCAKIFNLMFEGKKRLCKKPQFYIICITDNELCKKCQIMTDKKTCFNFLSQYADNIHGEINQETIKMRVQQLIQQKPHEIMEILHKDNPKQFIFQIIFQLILEKSQHIARKNIKQFMKSLRK